VVIPHIERHKRMSCKSSLPDTLCQSKIRRELTYLKPSITINQSFSSIFSEVQRDPAALFAYRASLAPY